jgi:hypothetical protein
MLWPCSNDYDTEVKYTKGTTNASDNQGVCSGLSIEWCKNMLRGTRPELSKPQLLQGMIYQRFYDFGFNSTGSDAATAKLFATAGVTEMSKQTEPTVQSVAASLWGLTGAFWIGYSNHAVAAAKIDGAGSFFFFDPNFGCYEVSSQQRLEQLLEQGRNAVGAENSVDFHKVQ